MDFIENYILNNNTLKDSTGNSQYLKTKVISYPLDRYIVKVIVSESNEFIGIKEISIKKDFMSLSQKILSYNTHDVEDFYKEED